MDGSGGFFMRDIMLRINFDKHVFPHLFFVIKTCFSLRRIFRRIKIPRNHGYLSEITQNIRRFFNPFSKGYQCPLGGRSRP